MSREYKNILRLYDKAFGKERRENLAKEALQDGTPLPKPLDYKHIDEEFKRWVEEDLDVSFEGEKLPTVALFSNQRFSEYMQSWRNVDEKKNILMNFKTITRENNPKQGTLYGETRNIPGERTYLMKRVPALDKAGRRYYIDYRVKQPFCVDLSYTVTVVTNKYELLNKFNLMIQEKFKSIQCFIRPQGHFVPMTLTDISDESQYSINDRQYYSQSYIISVHAYLMPEDSFIVEERPELKFMGFEGDAKGRSYAEIEELPCRQEESKYEFTPMQITIHFNSCDSKYEFTMDDFFRGEKIKFANIRSYTIEVNGTEIPELEIATEGQEYETEIHGLKWKDGDTITIHGLKKYNSFKDAEIIIVGSDYREAQEIK